MKKSSVFGGLLLLAVIAGVVINMPDIIRYLRMKSM